MGDPGGLLSILIAMGDEVDIAICCSAWCRSAVDGTAQWWDGTGRDGGGKGSDRCAHLSLQRFPPAQHLSVS
jgi:hypothetical protein